mgnify:CR=1 FL=1
MQPKEDFFSRNLGIISEDEQALLSNYIVAIAGLGGVGGIQAVSLGRTGIGGFNLADPETFGPTDINRQYGATVETLGKNKAEVTGEILKSINPSSKIKIFKNGINKEEISDFLDNTSIVIDAIEYFALDEKILLHRSARERGLYVLTSPIIGYGSSLFVFSPDGMTFEEFFEISPDKDALLNYALYAKKFSPVIPDYLTLDSYVAAIKGERPLPSFGPSASLSGSLLASEAIFILLGKREPVIAPLCKQIDLYKQSFSIIDYSSNVPIISNIDDLKHQDFKWRRLWDDFAPRAYDSLADLSIYKEMVEKMLEYLEGYDNILDVGCGTGNLLIRLAQKGKTVYGIDSSKGMLKKTKEKIKEIDGIESKIHLEEQYASKLLFADESFDAVTCLNVLYNLKRPVDAMKESYRVLKKGGAYIITSPTPDVDVEKKIAPHLTKELQNPELDHKGLAEAFRFNMILEREGGIEFKPSIEEYKTIADKIGFEIEFVEELYFGQNYLIKFTKS